MMKLEDIVYTHFANLVGNKLMVKTEKKLSNQRRYGFEYRKNQKEKFSKNLMEKLFNKINR